MQPTDKPAAAPSVRKKLFRRLFLYGALALIAYLGLDIFWPRPDLGRGVRFKMDGAGNVRFYGISLANPAVRNLVYKAVGKTGIPATLEFSPDVMTNTTGMNRVTANLMQMHKAGAIK